MEREGLDYGATWTPDGAAVLFASDRAGDVGLWRLDVDGGEPAGAPVEVKPATGRIVPVGMTPDGSFYYGVHSGYEDVYVGEMSSETGVLLGRPRLAVEQFVGFNFYPAWSPDGEQLAYISSRHAVSRGGTPGAQTLVIRSLAGSREVEHATTFNIVAAGRWFPDGESLLIPACDLWRRWFLYRVDVDSGKAEPLTGPLTLGNSRFARPTVSPDGRTIYYIAGQPETSYIVAHDTLTREERELHRVRLPRRLQSLAVSPDGSRLAYRTTFEEEGTWRISWTISTMPVSGGSSSEIFRYDDAPGSNYYDHGLEWTPDGEYLLLPASEGDEIGGAKGSTWDILRIPAGGGPAERLGLPGRRHRFPSVHPDGRQIAFDTSSNGEWGRELWVLENFLPAGRGTE